MTEGPSGIAVMFVALAVAGCQRHVQMKFPDTSPGAQYTCSITTSQVENCVPRTDIDPADDNRATTTFVILPRACAGRFNEITIQDSGSSETSVNVKCAPLEAAIVLPAQNCRGYECTQAGAKKMLAETAKRAGMWSAAATEELDRLFYQAASKMESEQQLTSEGFHRAEENFKKLVANIPKGIDDPALHAIEETRKGEFSLCPIWPFC
jgi:hypothetical protein